MTGRLKIEYQIYEDQISALSTGELELYLGVNGEIKLYENQHVLYSEVEFPLVEFAVKIQNWLYLNNPNLDFSYDSIESEDEGLIWFRLEPAGWRLGSVHQEECSAKAYTFPQISEACEKFIQCLTNELQTKFGIDITHMLTGKFEIS